MPSLTSLTLQALPSRGSCSSTFCVYAKKSPYFCTANETGFEHHFLQSFSFICTSYIVTFFSFVLPLTDNLPMIWFIVWYEFSSFDNINPLSANQSPLSLFYYTIYYTWLTGGASLSSKTCINFFCKGPINFKQRHTLPSHGFLSVCFKSYCNV